MAGTMSWSSAILVQCMLESLIYGISLVLFIQSVGTLLQKRRRQERLNMPLIVTAPLLFFFATLHILGATWMRVYRAFIEYPDGPEAYLTLITTPDKTLGQAGQISAVALADYMTVYRCWAIWGRNWLVVTIPVLTLIATFVSSIVFVTVQHHIDVKTSIFNGTVTSWTEAWLASSLCTTGICTALIIYRLTRVRSGLRDSGVETSCARTGTLTSRVILIIIESSAIYSVNNLLYCVLYAVKQVPETWFSNMESTIASITFSLIIIRVDQAVASGIELVSTRSMRPTSLGRCTSNAPRSPQSADGIALDFKPDRFEVRDEA
ncbi:hypothetical protein EXIGLDRAFT_843162 [Exidia glandulosa HHB12029]|uniref:Fungal pheromone STE3G-protein-coupled receptor n=1 Tax=Exidia glandulosa HHB12029 TaxID=1314781 RepID=A0A165CV05_EXIGL|nr:hypothetical protein EXIGLDRAFT_843162 [Exidia glandulosa HHB12029]